MNLKYVKKFSKTGRKSFLNLPETVQKRIRYKIEDYFETEDPMQYAKKLTGMSDKYRWRIGDYRVIFKKNNQKELVILVIVKVGHRQDIYKE